VTDAGQVRDVKSELLCSAVNRAAHAAAAANRVTVGGLTDAGFAMLAQLDTRQRGAWPF